MKNLIYQLLDLTFGDFVKELIESIQKKREIIIFDVGCYKGNFFKKFYYNKRVKNLIKFYLFDPNPGISKKIFSLKKKNRKINFYNVAVGKNNSKSYYYLNQNFEASGSSLKKTFLNDKKWNYSRYLFLKLFFQKTQGYKKFKVAKVSLDNFCKINNIKRIDILKIDTEGGEVDVLLGGLNILKRGIIKNIQIEVTENKNTYDKKMKRINNILVKRNFEFIKNKELHTVALFSNIRSTENLYKYRV